MKTTLLNLSEATRLEWGIDPYNFDIENDILDLENNTGSIADTTGDKIVEFKLLSRVDSDISNWDIEITKNYDELTPYL